MIDAVDAVDAVDGVVVVANTALMVTLSDDDARINDLDRLINIPRKVGLFS